MKTLPLAPPQPMKRSARFVDINEAGTYLKKKGGVLKCTTVTRLLLKHMRRFPQNTFVHSPGLSNLSTVFALSVFPTDEIRGSPQPLESRH